MKKIVSVLMLVFALILGGCGAGGDFVNEDYKFENLNSQISNLQTQIDGLQTQLAGLDNVSGDNVVVIDETTINNITNQIAQLQDDLDALELQIGADNNKQVSVEQTLINLAADIKTLKEEIARLDGLIGDLECYEDTGREAGGPAYVFSGAGEPGAIEGARAGDFYISTTRIYNGDFGYVVYLYVVTPAAEGVPAFSGWVEFGQIKVGTGDAVTPAPLAPISLERF